MDSKSLVQQLYKNDRGEPFTLTNGQILIFDAIFKKEHPRVHIQMPTRYGKSETISMAVLTRAATYPEKWAIVAGTKDKARIIIDYCIRHIFDNEYTRARFVIDKGESEENIKRFKNKNRINFKVDGGLLGEIFITTAEGALGLGASNVVEDESGLINVNDHALVMRMLGDHPENFLAKVGNPWDCEHFRKSFEDPNYYKILIDYVQAIKEGRLTPAYVDEMRKQPFFDVLYECKFPKQGIMLEKGWIQLLTRNDIERAMIDTAVGFGVNKLGVDVAGGGKNFSVIVQRFTNYARKRLKSNSPDTMEIVESVMSLKLKDKPQEASVDPIGIGKGTYDMLYRLAPGWARPVNVAEFPMDKLRFTNKRAENYWKLREWIITGGKLERDEDWFELTKIKYRVKLEGTRGKMQIMSKEEMLAEGTQSPDVADALMLTFDSPDVPAMDEEEREMEEYEQNQRNKNYDPFRPFDI